MDFTAFKFSKFASAAELEDRKHATLSSMQCEEPKKPIPSPTFPEELVSYLRIIKDNPSIQATRRDRLVGISLRKGNRLRKQLQDLGLIQEFQANPGGRGQAFLDVRLTPKGEAVLEGK